MISYVFRRPISESLCTASEWSSGNCPQIQGLFSYMKNWGGSECGVVGTSWCAPGKDYVAGPGKEYYAYCARYIGYP